MRWPVSVFAAHSPKSRLFALVTRGGARHLAGMILIAAHAGLFLAAFVAATLVPMQSEPVYLGLVLKWPDQFVLALAVATIGNTAGSLVNYALGWGLVRGGLPKRFHIPPETLARAQGWFGRWGVWALVLAWLPLGDVLTVVAGSLRTPLWQFVVLVGLGKGLRYLVLGLVALGIFGA